MLQKCKENLLFKIYSKISIFTKITIFLLNSDLGVHIDGFIALVAHTIVVGATADKPVEGRAADVILAAYNAIQGAFRLLKPGNLNSDATKLIQKVADSYKCSPLEGVLSHELKKHLIDGNNCIINKETFEQKVEERELQVNEVYGLDVIVSTAEGKPKEVIFLIFCIINLYLYVNIFIIE